MQAAQTGHLVLSTLHTDDAPSVVTRLMDIGTEPYVIAVGARRGRRAAARARLCVVPPAVHAAAETLRAMNISENEAAAIPFYKSVGCDQCNHTGYKGRIGIYEVMRVNDKLRRAHRARRPKLRSATRGASGMITLGEDGLAKVKSGVTTPEELLRVVTEVREVRTLCTGCGAAVGVDFVACPHCGSGRAAVSALQPRAAARLEFLSLLREKHGDQARRQTSAAAELPPKRRVS